MPDETATAPAAALAKTYVPAEVEGSIYQLWLDSGAFDADPDPRPADQRYVVMMPLPNVTGALHMGHAMDNVIQDLLIRWHRMIGDNTLWMPGTDHAGIATQAVIEKRLKELEGLTRHDIGREELVRRIWDWKDQYEQRIVSQQQRMGCSCDWRRDRFTMDDVCARAVRHWFFKMFADGLVFRGQRLVNWDPFLQTSVSDDEVYHKTVEGHFWHLRYPVIDPGPDEPTHVVVATTRPETMLGDTAVAVHPDPTAALAARHQTIEQALTKASDKDRAAVEAELAELERRQAEVLPSLVKLCEMARAGRRVRLPLLDREMPLICDEWAKPELGSGCVKITPAHDPNDYDVWTRHKDEIGQINILNADGTLNAAAGPYAELDRFEARERVVKDLEQQGLLDLVEDRQVEVGHSDRSKTPIEPYLSDQWFIHMADVEGGITMGRGTLKEHRTAGLVQGAIDAVNDGRVKIHPERYTKTYLDWLAEKRDWPISRQLWWGHRLPVWSLRGSGPVTADGDGALDLCRLAALCGDGSRAFCRVNLPERDVNLAVLPDGTLEGGAELPAAGEPLCLDVCLLADDPELTRQLAELGFVQDPDVLDTWFSSALWPFSTLGWPDPQSAALAPGQPPLGAIGAADDCLSYYYPGSCLVTARDIITLWVARMVIAGLYNLGEIPFSDVFIHANIQDGKGERMSKSKGNGIDPVDIIERYGTDAMRYVLCEMQTGSQDIRLPVKAVCPSCGVENELAETAHGKTDAGTENLFTYVCGAQPEQKKLRKGACGAEFDVLGTLEGLPKASPYSDRFEQGRAFCTKLWNSARFAFINLGAAEVPTTSRSRETLEIEDRWILDRLNLAVGGVQRSLEQYNPAAAINSAREFFWSALCDWYLELIKPRLAADADQASAALARQVLAFCLDQVLRLLHPFVPFITEHLWQRLGELVPERGLGEQLATAPASAQLIAAAWPRHNPALEDAELRETFADLQAVVRTVREVRASTGTTPRQPLAVTIKAPPDRRSAIEAQAHVIERLANVRSLTIDPEATRSPGAAAKLVGELQVFVHDVIDDGAERARLEGELKKIEKEISSCEKKLGNPRFVDRAPAEVVEEQQQRLDGYRASREALHASLAELG